MRLLTSQMGVRRYCSLDCLVGHVACLHCPSSIRRACREVRTYGMLPALSPVLGVGIDRVYNSISCAIQEEIEG
jgi:hypothetical protein